MIQSYNFLIKAYHNSKFQTEIIEHINMKENSEIIFQNALLKFDYGNRKIIELPYSSAKVWTMEISYDDFIAMMNNDDPIAIIEKACKFFD